MTPDWQQEQWDDVTMANRLADKAGLNKEFYRRLEKLLLSMDQTKINLAAIFSRSPEQEQKRWAEFERKWWARQEQKLQEDWEWRERKHEQTRQEYEQVQQECELQLHATRIDGLLCILDTRKMRLTKAQEKRLRTKPYTKLPPLQLALEAKDASDFARRARLTNSRR